MIGKKYSDFEKGFKKLKVSITRVIKDFILITLGIFSAAFGFKGFLLTNHFIDGGATGISLLISVLTKIPLYVLLILVNIPLSFLLTLLLESHLPSRQRWPFQGLLWL